jgi:hypothetical protein
VGADPAYPVHFVPYVAASLFTMAYASGFTFTVRGVWFTLASFPVHVGALLAALFRRPARFVVTSKAAAEGSLAAAAPQAAAAAVLAGAVLAMVARDGATPVVAGTVAFACAHVALLGGFVHLAFRPAAPYSRRDTEAAEGLGRTLAGLAAPLEVQPEQEKAL